MPDPLLIAKGLNFSYSKKSVLEQLDLSLSAGEIVSLLGPNGSGKSTLLKLLLGHLHGKGQITWNDRPIAKWSRRELARLVAYLPQNPLIDESQSVAEVLALGRAPYWGAFGLETESDAATIRTVVDQLQIERPLLNRRLDQLSGGQRQRIFVARCLIQQPKMLLLDEPTNNLDLRHQLQLLTLLRELAHGQNLAVLMSAHDINLAADFSDRLVLLQDGKKLADGPPADILQADLLANLYGIPMELIPRDGRSPVVFPASQKPRTPSIPAG
jgi:ABC-type cobalamin/Fe3+-siderophores transport system ATPase subunit